MKSFYTVLFAALGLLACTISALAVPEDNPFPMSSASMSIENMNIMDMEVTDDRFPGITFTGTAQSVYEQMKALKPNAFPDDVDVDTVETRSLQKRSILNCEWGTDVVGFKSCNDGYNWMKRLGRATCCVGPGKASCARVSCSYRCGVFLCNKTDNNFCPACGDVADDMKYIMSHCDSISLSCPAGARDFDGHFVGINQSRC